MASSSALKNAIGLSWSRLLLAGFGFVPISCLSLALLGWIPLHLSAPATVPAIVVLTLWLRVSSRPGARRAILGLVAGVVAVAVYDSVRLSLVALGLWSDFIPVIGQMALDDPNAHWLWGYAWRFLLNGGAMGLAFAALGMRGVRSGVAFGLFVCSCLFVLLLVSPRAQAGLFTLNAASVSGALVGHIVYGAVLARTLLALERRAEHTRDRSASRRLQLDLQHLPR